MLLSFLVGSVAMALKVEYAVIAPEMSWYRAAKACESHGWRLARVNQHNTKRVDEVLHQSGYTSGWVGSWEGRLAKNSAFLFRAGRDSCCEIDTVSIIPKCSLNRCVKKRVAICEIKCKQSHRLHKRSYDSASVYESVKNRNEPVVVYSSIKPTHNILVNRKKSRRLVIVKVKCPSCKQRLQKRAYSHGPKRSKGFFSDSNSDQKPEVKKRLPEKRKKTGKKGHPKGGESLDVSAEVSLKRSRRKCLVHYSESTVEEIEPAPHKCHHKPLVPRAIRHHRRLNRRLRRRERKLSASASLSI